MKRRRLFWSLFSLCALATVVYAAGTFMSVQVETTRVRTTPSFFSGTQIAVLRHGDRVEVVGTKGTWMQVRLGDGRTGWVSKSALVAKKIVLTGKGKDAKIEADKEELALAGRGFNQEVESSYRKGNRRIDYRWVDQMEKGADFQVSEAEMRTFVLQGRKIQPEGGL